ncbi:MAG: hypothetical protein HS113_20575 [Verrucomicrobiales bacterium]|nr:hypothetical protein [Verrucomicrobiales bacterium]
MVPNLPGRGHGSPDLVGLEQPGRFKLGRCGAKGKVGQLAQHQGARMIWAQRLEDREFVHGFALLAQRANGGSDFAQREALKRAWRVP